LAHVPQLAASVIVSTHTPEQVLCPAAQPQAPLVQAWPPAHLLPQKPQLVASVWVFAQLLPQAVSPVAQPAAHLFCEHTRPPLQTVPQAPQLLPSETMLTQPVGQAESPAVQAHVPLVQLWPSAHFLLHAPQF
jgi:hypothetical protein